MPGSAEMARADVGYWDIIFFLDCGQVKQRRRW